MTTLKKWSYTPKTPKTGFITDYRLLMNEFDIVAKIGNSFKKFTSPLVKLSQLRSLPDFKYANVYDVQYRVQVLSIVKSGKITWFLKRIKDINP
ncbi:hypothetical protein ACR79P_06475 [Sphingobacterium spiritivorum]|uniref:hypothetical protein n=1 Tax=Sphingobacterium spiritivorum TaxID=258 RepID=UPI003DA395EA